MQLGDYQMADPYLVNLSFRAESLDRAEAFTSEVGKLSQEMEESGRVSDVEIGCARDWLAVPRRSTPLRVAANKQITDGPPEDELD